MNELIESESAAVHTLMDGLVRGAKVPGIQYLVVAPGGIAFEYTGGWADIAGQRPMLADTTMMAYSMSKTITATAVLQLVETQNIRLDDPVSKFVESLPYGPQATVRQLLTHTSGIPNPIPLKWVHTAAQHYNFDEHAELAKILQAYPHLTSSPGSTYRYSNIGYWLLGTIIENVSGQSFPSYVREHVLRPLGITSEELDYVVPDYRHHAKGYLEKYSVMNLVKRLLIAPELIGDYEGRWLHIRDHYVNGAAFGGLVGNARGFGKFLADQLRPRSAFLGEATRTLLYTPQHTRRGDALSMTPGWHIGQIDSHRCFYKEGGGGGFHCMMRVYPARSIATVVMSNSTGCNVGKLLNRIDRRFLTASSRQS